MDRMVIQHTNNNKQTNNHTQRAAQSGHLNTVAVDPFTEISDFVHQLYKELVAQNQPHAFNDFSCVFCDAAYLELQHLSAHLESVHRHQVHNGTFQLQPDFEEIIRKRILQAGVSNQHQHHRPSAVESALPPTNMEAPPGHMYQCAKCFATFAQMDDVTQHVAQCSMNFNYQQQEPQQSHQAHQANAQQLLQQQQHLDQLHQQHQQHSHQQPQTFNNKHQQHSVVAGNVHQQQHHQQHQHYQQQPQQLSVPIIETPTTVPIRHKIYGCALCGLRFRVVRELVMHLHVCVDDIFHDKAQFLTPELWLQAPDGQHIVINEPESNTTLNTTGLWLMSNDVVSSPDIVSKGFWVMPPHHTGDDILQTPIKSEPIVAGPSVIAQPTHDNQMAYNNYQDVQQHPPTQSNVVQNSSQVPAVNSEPLVAWKKQSTPHQPKTPADENKRKRNTRAKAAPKNHKDMAAVPLYNARTSVLATSSATILHAQQPQVQQNMYMNGGSGTTVVADHQNMLTVPQPPPIKRKRYEQQQIQQQHQLQQLVQEYAQHSGDLDASHSFNINEFNEQLVPPIGVDTNAEQHHQLAHHTLHQQPQHIISKDGLLYEQLDFDFASANGQTPNKLESNAFALDQTVADALNIASPKTAPQQHFKKKMQLQARSAAASAQIPLPHKPVVEPLPQLLAIIANPEDLEDLSHLDTPIIPTKKVQPLMAKQTDYISSYCSFLKNRVPK